MPPARRSPAARPLIVDELRGRKMPRAAELIGVNQSGLATFDRLGHEHLLHQRMALAPGDFRAEPSTSYWSVRTTAPSTAVSPATASMVRISLPLSSLEARASSARAENGGDTA